VGGSTPLGLLLARVACSNSVDHGINEGLVTMGLASALRAQRRALHRYSNQPRIELPRIGSFREAERSRWVWAAAHRLCKTPTNTALMHGLFLCKNETKLGCRRSGAAKDAQSAMKKRSQRERGRAGGGGSGR